MPGRPRCRGGDLRFCQRLSHVFFVASLRIPIDLQVLGRVIRQEFVFVLVCISILDYEESSGPFFFSFGGVLVRHLLEIPPIMHAIGVFASFSSFRFFLLCKELDDDTRLVLLAEQVLPISYELREGSFYSHKKPKGGVASIDELWGDHSCLSRQEIENSVCC